MQRRAVLLNSLLITNSLVRGTSIEKDGDFQGVRRDKQVTADLLLLTDFFLLLGFLYEII